MFSLSPRQVRQLLINVNYLSRENDNYFCRLSTG